MSFYKLLAIAFIVLKLCGVIEWHWVWVASPFWIGLILETIWGSSKDEPRN